MGSLLMLLKREILIVTCQMLVTDLHVIIPEWVQLLPIVSWAAIDLSPGHWSCVSTLGNA